eukprot:1782410-Rhodomonas_salina.1
MHRATIQQQVVPELCRSLLAVLTCGHVPYRRAGYGRWRTKRPRNARSSRYSRTPIRPYAGRHRPYAVLRHPPVVPTPYPYRQLPHGDLRYSDSARYGNTPGSDTACA